MPSWPTGDAACHRRSGRTGDPDAELALCAGPRGVLPQHEHERRRQVRRLARQPVGPAGPLADVPGVDAVVHQLERRVEEGGQPAHVEVGDVRRSTPRRRAPRTSPSSRSKSWRIRPRELGAGRPEPCAISSQRAAIPGRPWAGPLLWLRAASNDHEVRLRRVHEVSDDIADLPVARAGGRLPRLVAVGQVEELVSSCRTTRRTVPFPSGVMAFHVLMSAPPAKRSTEVPDLRPGWGLPPGGWARAEPRGEP